MPAKGSRARGGQSDAATSEGPGMAVWADDTGLGPFHHDGSRHLGRVVDGLEGVCLDLLPAPIEQLRNLAGVRREAGSSLFEGERRRVARAKWQPCRAGGVSHFVGRVNE